MTTATQRQYGRTSLRAKDGTAAILSTARQVGPLISTITDDVNAVQDFVSTSLLDILIDGSGKSTLVRLIPGFYDLVSGTVSIDGALFETRLAEWAAQIGETLS